MFQSFHVKLSKNRSIMNKKTSLPNNKRVSQRNTKHNELTNEQTPNSEIVSDKTPEESNIDKSKTKVTPMSKDPLMGIF